jgi:hypothetical protein
MRALIEKRQQALINRDFIADAIRDEMGKWASRWRTPAGSKRRRES